MTLSIQAVTEATGFLFVWKHLRSSLLIRGQVVPVPGTESFYLLGSPWVRKPQELREWNLSLDDFAVHDATPELIQASVSNRLAVDDLRRIAAKLDLQRSELRDAIDRIRAGEQHRQLLSLIVSRSSNAVIVWNPEGHIEWVNDSFTQLTGYSLNEALGARPGDLLEGPRTDQEIIREMGRALAAGDGFRCVLANYKKNGQLFWNRLEVQPIRTDGGTASNVVSWLSDVTAEREAAAQKELTLRLTRLLAEGSDSQQATQEILRLICQATGACYAGLWWADADNRAIRLAQFWACDELTDSLFLSKSRALEFQPGQGLPGRSWQQNAVLALPNIEAVPGWPRKELALHAGLRSGIAFPIRTAGKTLGVIEIFATGEDILPGFLVPVVESLGVKIGHFIERRSAEAERDRLLSLLQSAVDSAPEGVVISDDKGHAVRSNEKWRTLVGSGLAADQSRWSDVLTRQFKWPAEQLVEWSRMVSLSDQSRTGNFELLDGRTIEAITNPHTHEGRTVGQIWLFRDITGTLAAEKERDRLVANLNSTLESTNDGILVTSVTRERIVFNQRFLDMWRIPRSAAESNRNSSLVPFVLDQMLDPERFQQRVHALYQDIAATATDVFELTDGRVFELYTQPQQIGDRIIGRVWCYRDVSRQWAAHRSLQDSEQRYRFVAETAPDAIITFDGSGHIRFVNRNAIARFGGGRRDLLGMQVSGWFPEAKSRQYTRLLRRFSTAPPNDGFPPLELSLVDAASQVFPAEVKLGVDSHGEERLVTAVVRDISQRKAIDEQVRQAAKAAAAANRAKSDFLANISHEIRTPLNAIVGLTELLRASSVSGETREAVDSIWVSAESLLALINDLLDVSKIEAGQIDLDYQDFDPSELAERAIDVVRIRASAKSLPVYYFAEPPRPPILRGDPNRIRQVLVNLLSNAVKFTGSGSITLRLGWEVVGTEVALEYSVEDTGIGIAPTEQARIFENFYRTESPLTAQNGGAGLGLAISRAIAQRLGGSLTVRSSLGEGSTFTFSLPGLTTTGDSQGQPAAPGKVLVATMAPRIAVQMAVVRSAGFIPAPCVDMGSWPEETGAFAAILIDEEWAEAENWSPPASGQILWLRMTGRSAELDHRPLLPSPLTPARLSRAVAALAAPEVSPTQQFALDSHTQGRRILLVEDSPAGQLYFRKLLASQAYDVTVASTAADAHSLARSAVFDLILMDIQLPDGSGIDVIRELRASEDAAGRARVPIIALSAHALADCKASALAAGADDYITKPVRVGELLKGVRQRLVRRVNVLILAQSQTLLDAALRLCPSASGILIGEDGEFQVPFTEEPFRVVILIADGPSVSFVSSAFKSLKEFPPERLLLLGDRWPRECVNLAGGAEALPVPESASALDRLVQLTASHTAPEAGTDLSSKFAKEIAILAPSYLKELNDSISNARGDLAAGNLSQLAGFAHRVKGSGAAYGFPTLTLLAAKLEEAARQEDRSVAARTLESLADEISQALVRKNAI